MSDWPDRLSFEEELAVGPALRLDEDESERCDALGCQEAAAWRLPSLLLCEPHRAELHAAVHGRGDVSFADAWRIRAGVAEHRLLDYRLALWELHRREGGAPRTRDEEDRLDYLARKNVEALIALVRFDEKAPS